MLKEQIYRFMSHITFGDTHKKWRQKYKQKHQKKPQPATIKTNEFGDILKITRLYAQARDLHQKSFAKYKNKFAGKNVVLVATGPSLNSFKPIKNAIYVGVNAAFLNKDLKFDYLFAEDWFATSKYLEKAKEYKCKKFYGITDYTLYKDKPGSWLIPESVAISHKADRFISFFPPCGMKLEEHVPFAYDICCEPLWCWGSIVFPALQFILYTNPKKIYIVGCDCTTSGHFNNKKSKIGQDAINYVLSGWKLLKDFANRYYPETEIISVNPVGLRGLFKDLYQGK